MDADGNTPFLNVYPYAYSDLAWQLTKRGHEVLRFAKRGPDSGS